MSTHEHGFFHRGGGYFFSVCTQVKNAFMGDDVFGCHSMCERGVKRGDFLFTEKKRFFEIFLKIFYCILINSQLFLALNSKK